MRKLLILLTIIVLLSATWVAVAPTPAPCALDSKVGVSRTRCGLGTTITGSANTCYIEGNDITTIAQTNPATGGLLGNLAGTTLVTQVGASVPAGTNFIDLKLISGTNPPTGGLLGNLGGTTFIDSKLLGGTNPAYFASANASSVSWTGAQGTTGTTVKSSAGAIKFISCDNSQNSAITYLSFYDGAAPLIGSTVPTFQLTCTSGTTAGAVIGLGPTNFPVDGDGGVKFATALIVAASTNTAVTLNPTNKIGLTIIYK